MEKTFKGYKLFFKDLLAENLIIHSDTLYSLIIDTLSNLGLLPDDLTNPGFRVSSAFPFYQDYCFFPMPVDFLEKIPENIILNNNGYLFISESLLKSYFDGALNQHAIYQNGAFLSETNNPINMINTITIPEQINAGSDSLIIHRFKDNTGLYFFTEFDTNNAEKNFLSALGFLSDEGIGKMRNIGKGHFVYKEFQIDLPSSISSNKILVSLYSPLKEEIETNLLINTNIVWIKRAKNPYLNTNRESKSFYMAKEGSVFRETARQLTGNIIKLFNPNKKLNTGHYVYRFGTPFFIG